MFKGKSFLLKGQYIIKTWWIKSL